MGSHLGRSPAAVATDMGAATGNAIVDDEAVRDLPENQNRAMRQTAVEVKRRSGE